MVSYARAQGKDDEIVTIVSRSCQIRRTLKALETTLSLPGLNITPAKYTSITSGLTHDVAEDDYPLLNLLGIP